MLDHRAGLELLRLSLVDMSLPGRPDRAVTATLPALRATSGTPYAVSPPKALPG